MITVECYPGCIRNDVVVVCDGGNDFWFCARFDDERKMQASLGYQMQVFYDIVRLTSADTGHTETCIPCSFTRVYESSMRLK